jgi:hypothetical protein
MPPRKKATTAVPSRASARIKSTTAAQPAAPSQPVTASSKRDHADSETEDDSDTPTSKPVRKKAKKTKKQNADTQDDQKVDTTASSQPAASDEPKKMVTETSIRLLIIQFSVLLRSL